MEKHQKRTWAAQAGLACKVTAWSCLVLLFYCLCESHGRVYKPPDFALRSEFAVLNLGTEINLLGPALECCSTKFSSIFLEFSDASYLEAFLDSPVAVVNNRTENKGSQQVELVLSFRRSVASEEDWFSEFDNILRRAGSLDNLKSKMVTGISISNSNKNFCSLGASSSSSTENNDVELGNYLRNNGLVFGLELDFTLQVTAATPRKCNSDSNNNNKSVMISPKFQHQPPSFLVIRITMDHDMVYSLDKFSQFLSVPLSAHVAKLTFQFPATKIIFKVEMELLKLGQRVSNLESLSAYENLVSAFSYAFAKTFIVAHGATKVRAMGNYDVASDGVREWTELVELQGSAYSACCQTIADTRLVDSSTLPNREREALLNILSRDFNTIQVDTLGGIIADFWSTFSNLTYTYTIRHNPNNTIISGPSRSSSTVGGRRLRFEILSPLGGYRSRGWDDVMKDVEQLAGSSHPGLVESFIIELPFEACFPTVTPENDDKYVNSSMLQRIGRRLHPLGILLGITDCNTGWTRYKINDELQKHVDFIQITVITDSIALDSLPNELEKIRASNWKRYMLKPVHLKVHWRSGLGGGATFSDCREYRVAMATFRNWAAVHFQRVIVAEGFNPEGGSSSSWYKQLTYSTFKKGSTSSSPSFLDQGSFFTELEDTCVTLDDGEITKPINFNKSRAGITLRLDQGAFKGQPLSTSVLLYQLSTLRFSVVEIDATEEIRRLPQLFEAIAKDPDSQSGIDVYVNLKPHTISHLISSDDAATTVFPPHIIKNEATTSYNIRGFHLDLSTTNSSSSMGKPVAEFARFTSIIKKSSSLSSVSFGHLVTFRGQTVVDSQEETELLLAADYVILDVDLLQVIHLHKNGKVSVLDLNKPEDILKEAVPRLWLPQLYPIFQALRGLRHSIRRVKPGLNVMLRCRWPSVGIGNNINNNNNSVFHALQIWNFVDDWSRAFAFPYLIYEAVGVQESPGSYGWWEVKYYNDLGNGSVYTDKESEYLGRVTLRPKPKSQVDLLAAILIPAIALMFIIILATVFLIIRVWRKNLVLSSVEVKDFLYGVKHQQGQGAGRGTERDIELEIMGRGYNKSELEITPHDFILGNSVVLGVGNFGMVYKSVMPRFGGEVAVKIPKIEGTSAAAATTIRSLLAEIKIMSYIGEHENVLKLLGAYTKELQKGNVYVVTEFCENGSLLSYLRSLATSSSVAGGSGGGEIIQAVPDLLELSQFCVEIARGMDYLGSKRVIHGDLSARNVLLTGSKICKISDFGLSRQLETKYDVYKKQGADPLPWRWMAIESLQRKEFTVKSDVWAYGVTIWEVFSLGEQPFPEVCWDGEYCRKLEEGLRLGCPKLVVSPEIYNKMRNCWNLEPVERPGFAELAMSFGELQSSQYITLTE